MTYPSKYTVIPPDIQVISGELVLRLSVVPEWGHHPETLWFSHFQTWRGSYHLLWPPPSRPGKERPPAAPSQHVMPGAAPVAMVTVEPLLLRQHHFGARWQWARARKWMTSRPLLTMCPIHAANAPGLSSPDNGLPLLIMMMPVSPLMSLPVPTSGPPKLPCEDDRRELCITKKHQRLALLLVQTLSKACAGRVWLK